MYQLSSSSMAFTTSMAATVITTTLPVRKITKRRVGRPRLLLPVASKVAARPPKVQHPGIDTRIHWDNEDEGWIGGIRQRGHNTEVQQDIRNKLSELLRNTHNSHYELLGVSDHAGLEEIKSAYRNLLEECRHESAVVPVKVAHDKFAHLQEAFDVLSNETKRQSYDRGLIDEAVCHQGDNVERKLDDPYEQDVRNSTAVPDMVDRLSGRNMKLGDQILAALSIDLVAIMVSICCIVYALLFKELS